MSSSRYLRRGYQLYQAGDVLGSASAYRRYVASHVEDKTGHYNLAVALVDSQQLDAAMQSYGRALEIDPWYPEALNNLGILLQVGGNLNAARQCYLRALVSRPGYEDAEYNLATAEGKEGNHVQAVIHFSRVLERNPQRADAWNNLGNTLL